MKTALRLAGNALMGSCRMKRNESRDKGGPMRPPFGIFKDRRVTMRTRFSLLRLGWMKERFFVTGSDFQTTALRPNRYRGRGK